MRRLLVGALILLGVGLVATQADEGKALRSALDDHELQGDWIYDDADAGLAEGRKTGKPVLISFRCVP